RGENYLGGIDAGEWVRFKNVDFGTSIPRFDRIEIGTQQNSSLDVQLRIGSPTGQLIGTLNVPSRGEPWFMTREDISSVTGTHDLYLVFQGAGGSIGKFDRVRLLHTSVGERVTLGVKDYGDQATKDIGGAYWADSPEVLTFTTGPNATSATIFIAKQGGNLNGYVDEVAFTGNAFQVVGLPGDFNGDTQVDEEDLPFWQNDFGQRGTSGGDADADSDSDGKDFLIWQQNFGVGVPRELIGETIGNGSFENFAGGQGAPEQTNTNRVSASFDTSNVTDTQVATIPGWTVFLERYLDGSSGNVFAGFDSAENRSLDGTRYAFANKRSRATLTSDPVAHATQAGDEFTLTFNTGSFTSDDAAYIVRLRFGTNTHEIDTFTETINGNGVTPAYSLARTYTYTATASDVGAAPVVEFVINAEPNINGTQWYVDAVRMEVRNRAAPSAFSSSLGNLQESVESAGFAAAPVATDTYETPISAFRSGSKNQVLAAAIAGYLISERDSPMAKTESAEPLYAFELRTRYKRPSGTSAWSEWVDESMAAYGVATEKQTIQISRAMSELFEIEFDGSLDQDNVMPP
ncbi:MAG: carbohydrate-binding protein, partial [Lacipirellulaceae bacterium]